MSFFSILLLYIVGLSVVYLISPKISLIERVGLSFPLGAGVMSIYAFFLSVLSVKLNVTSLTIGLLLISAVAFFFLVKRSAGIKSLFDFSNIFADFKVQLKNVQVAWVVGLIAIIYVLYAFTVKSMFWPTIHYDAISGYDLLAKAIAHEGTLHNTVMDPANGLMSVRALYPPLFSMSFAYAYIFGFAAPKIITTLLFISMAIIYYGYSLKFTNPVATVFFLFFLLITPEMLAQSAMLMTNMPQAVYTLAGVGAFFIWYKTREQGYFILSSIMIALGLWSRSEGLMFFAIIGLMLVIMMFKDRKNVPLFCKVNIRQLLLMGLPAVFLFLVWSLYLKVNSLDGYGQPFSIIPFYDPEKIQLQWNLVKDVTLSTRLYGDITIAFFVVVVLSFIYQYFTKKVDVVSNFMLVFILASLALYLLLYYQIKVDLDFFRSYINNAYKRGLFNYIPLMALYMSSTSLMRGLFDKMYFSRNV